MRLDDRGRKEKVGGPWPANRERRSSHPLPIGLRRLAVAALALSVAAAGGVVALQAFLRGEPRGNTDRSEPTSPAPADPKVAATIRVGGWPRELAVAERVVWVVVQQEDPPLDVLVRLDPSTNTVGGRTILEEPLQNLVAGNGSVWGAVFRGGEPALQRYDEHGNITAHITGLGGPLAFGQGVLWATKHEEDGSSVLVRLDPATGRVQEDVPLGETAWDVTTGEGAVWVLTLEGEADILRIDADTNRVTARIDIPGPGSVGPPAAGGGFLWVPRAQRAESWIARLDGGTGRVIGDPIPQAFPVNSPTGVAAGAVWFIGDRPGGQVISRLNMETLSFDASLRLDEAAARPSIRLAADLARDGATMWVANHRDSVTRIDLLAGTPVD